MKARLYPTLLFFLTLTVTAHSQTDVRAWYADGQVWVVWQGTPPLPLTYAIYAKATPFTNTDDANLIGRLFPFEWLPGAMRQQIDSTATYRIPNGQGGLYQLLPDEGLFVFTPHQAGSAYVAVVKYGQTAAIPGVNRTENPVTFQYDPVNDPVECHFQRGFLSAPGYVTGAYYMWADGRQNHWEGRPDFPIMANAAKNGMPTFFLLSAPTNLDTTAALPLTVWLHGGGGTAIQSLPTARPHIDIRPTEGLLLAHNDDLFGFIGTGFPAFETVTWHFGWRKNYDPFAQDSLMPPAPDTVINYTQRKYVWIDEWLVRRLNADPARININGHSMGGAGTTAISKAYADHYASATIFNNGFAGPDPGAGPLAVTLFGSLVGDFPTSLRDRNGQVVPMSKVFNLTDDTSPARDRPLTRSFHGKNDINETMAWSPYVVDQYRRADSLGHGMALYWSERDHNVNKSPGFNDHWLMGVDPNMQTVVENVAYEEANFRSDRAYPAFFNHRLDPANNDPGDGAIGTGPQGTGDDWGTWGGYHRWSDVEDEPGHWIVTAWLENSAVFASDNSPHEQLTADFAIRRPQAFLPDAQAVLAYDVFDAVTGDALQSGLFSMPNNDDPVTVPGIVVYREDVRKVRIQISYFAAAPETQQAAYAVKLFPVPARDHAWLRVESAENEWLAISILQPDGRTLQTSTVQTAVGTNTLPLALNDLPNGLYLVRLAGKNGVATQRLVKQ